jgi:beta-mannanase
MPSSPALSSPLALRILLSAVVIASVGVALADKGPDARASQGSTTPVVLGVSTEGITSETGKSLREFSSLTGATPRIAMWYQDWEEQWSTALLNPRFTVPTVEHGAVPMVTWEPFLSTTKSVEQPAYALSAIAEGRHDAYIWRAARETAAYGKPVFIRLAEEMNGSWDTWGAGVDGNTPASYIAMWRHVVSIFRLAHATNVRWVWSPNVHNGSTRPFQQYYPGDAWVDYVALDGYNEGSRLGAWQSFAQVFGKSYTELAALTTKPMMIAETASAEEGGSKSAWIEAIPQTIATQMPRVRAVVWFDRDKETDWRVNSSPSSLAAFQAVTESGFFSGSIQSLLEAAPPTG